jgi:hypothetical protein
VDGFLAWLETSTLGQIVRAAGPWPYAFLNLAHILGIAALFGAVLVLDLRLMGLWRRHAIGPFADAAAPVAGAGLALAFAAGITMLAANASDYIGNPFLLIKFPAIALGLVNVAVLRRSTSWRRARAGEPVTEADERRLAVTGAVSLCCWLTAVAAGRLIAYW